MKILTHPDEERYNNLGSKIQKTELGIIQFYNYESFGIKPENPDLYYLSLINGKRWWEWLINEWRSLFYTDEWPGWYCVKHNFKNDKRGFTMIFGSIRKKLIPLYKEILKNKRKLREYRNLKCT